KGFKSFPDRTNLVFSPGVSVVVGPNGSGKSNITDAVLWALGEQSPLAVRGQQMQDVIFSGGKGQRPRRYAEAEVVIDNSEGRATHRKRRRRGELELEQTRENLDRVLDVEREARARLRPLKQQAQAAEVHARLAREEMELRAELVADELRGQGDRLAAAEAAAS